MSRKLTSKCDGCGVEVVEGDDPGMGMGMVGLRRQSSEHWGRLTVSTSAFPAQFDLCEACTKRIVNLLELAIPKPETMMRYLGGHAMPFTPGDFMSPPSGPPWSKPGPASVPFSGLTPEDLKALGIEIPGLRSLAGAADERVYECPGCHTMRGAPSPGSICAHCGHQDGP